jgi:hypothetical protein
MKETRNRSISRTTRLGRLSSIVMATFGLVVALHFASGPGPSGVMRS